VIALINTERANASLPALAESGSLATAARGHSVDMAVNNFMSHTGSNGSLLSDRLAAVGYSASAWAENVAAGYGTPADVIAGWMGSTGHRENILGPYTQIGVGYAYCSGSQYGSYWTVDFGSP
jgi:uncharacterized protein YkwD